MYIFYYRKKTTQFIGISRDHQEATLIFFNQLIHLNSRFMANLMNCQNNFFGREIDYC